MSPQDVDLIWKIGILVAYVVGTGILIKNLNARNETLKCEIDTLHSKISTQSELIGNMKAALDMFKAPIELHEKIMGMVREESELARNKALAEFKAKADKGIAVLSHEMKELFGLSLDLVYDFAPDERIEKHLNRMSDNTVTKPMLITKMKESRAWWRSMRDALLAMPSAKWQDVLSSTPPKE
jgi:hypothetical protein